MCLHKHIYNSAIYIYSVSQKNNFNIMKGLVGHCKDFGFLL